jgi:hypothetical protein
MKKCSVIIILLIGLTISIGSKAQEEKEQQEMGDSNQRPTRSYYGDDENLVDVVTPNDDSDSNEIMNANSDMQETNAAGKSNMKRNSGSGEPAASEEDCDVPAEGEAKPAGKKQKESLKDRLLKKFKGSKRKGSKKSSANQQ